MANVNTNINSQITKNVATSKPVTAKEAIARANQQIWQREFNADYDQVMLRISNAPFGGLRFGQPLGPVEV